MARKKGKSSKKKSKKLTEKQKLWQHEYSLLQRREKSWKSKHNVVFNFDFTMPRRVTEKAIKELKSITWKKLTEEQKQKGRQTYREEQIKEELNRFDVDDLELDEETDYNWIADDSEDEDEDYIDESERLDQWLDETIEAILDTSDADRINPDTRDLLDGIIKSAREQAGDEAFKRFLLTGDIIQRLHNSAYNAISGSPTRSSQKNEWAINEFMEILNNGPLSDDQAFTARAYGVVQFDFSDWQD